MSYWEHVVLFRVGSAYDMFKAKSPRLSRGRIASKIIILGALEELLGIVLPARLHFRAVGPHQERPAMQFKARRPLPKPNLTSLQKGSHGVTRQEACHRMLPVEDTQLLVK